MFSFPSLEAVISLVRPTKAYLENEWVTGTKTRKGYWTKLTPWQGRRRAAVEIVETLFASAGEALVLASGLFVGIRMTHWLPF